MICLVLSLQAVAVSSDPNNLGARIATFWASRSCVESNCRNPVLVVEDHRIKVVRFDGGYREAYMQPDDLSAYLTKMPLSAWPEGPKMWVNRADFHLLKPGQSSDEARQSQQAQLVAVAEILQHLGLTRTDKDGHPY
jgi:hypothetical protein